MPGLFGDHFADYFGDYFGVEEVAGLVSRVFVDGQWQVITPKVFVAGVWTPAMIHLPS